MPSRRDVFRSLSLALGSAMGLALAVPGVRFLIDPLFKKGRGGEFRPLTRLGQLASGKPQSFPILDERRDGWVKYPREPVGSVWLIRRGEGKDARVDAFTAECPHKGCAIGLGADGQFACPCHKAEFDLEGRARNEVPPRDMDPLEVQLSDGDDPEVLVKFERFGPTAKERRPRD
jgi:menaquinol-cytochrome c reductase iron-sulfur subunit